VKLTSIFTADVERVCSFTSTLFVCVHDIVIRHMGNFTCFKLLMVNSHSLNVL